MNALSAAVAEIERDPGQRRAFESPTPCVVLAPPGSGKTKLLATRLALDLKTRIPEPHGAACITMTNGAADQLRDRLSALGAASRSNLFIGTVHSFALGCVVRPYALVAGREKLAAASLAQESDIADARAEAVMEVLGPQEDPDSRAIMGTLQVRRNLMDYSDDDPTTLGGPLFARLARRYEEILLDGGHYDFPDLIRHAVDLVENEEWVLRTLAARFPHIYVDEYQDLPPGLDRLVQSLCFDRRANAELFAVGDPDQAIFGFSGTAPHLIAELAERSNVHDVWLKQNFRNPKALIEAALTHLGEERTIEGRSEGGTLEAIECTEGFGQQMGTALDLVARAREEGTELEEIAILTRNNTDLDLILNRLAETELPIFERRERGYRQTPVTSLVESMAAWATQERDGRGVQLSEISRRLRRTVGADYDLLSRCFAILIAYRDRGEEPARELVEALADCGLQRALERNRYENDAYQFAKMRATYAEGGEFEDLSILELGFRARAKGRILVSTIHGAKGLEFDIVIIVGVDASRIPSLRAKDPHEEDEERRTFYVAITRARRAVYCLWSGWRLNRDGERWEHGPSEYLVKLGLL